MRIRSKKGYAPLRYSWPIVLQTKLFIARYLICGSSTKNLNSFSVLFFILTKNHARVASEKCSLIALESRSLIIKIFKVTLSVARRRSFKTLSGENGLAPPKPFHRKVLILKTSKPSRPLLYYVKFRTLNFAM